MTARVLDQRFRELGRELERERLRRKQPAIALLASWPELRRTVGLYLRLERERAALVAVQRHAVCDGFLPARGVDGLYTWRTADAIELFQRLNFLQPDANLDDDTRAAFAAGSRELAYRGVLRVLRERVIDATGLIEDGTAAAAPRLVMGRALDPLVMLGVRGHAPLPDAAPDLIGAATDVAARQLGWTGPAETRAFLERHREIDLAVAVALPAPPPYHQAHMELAVEVDRGDVWYDARPMSRSVARRPALILYAITDGVRRALVRWPTTIGGWADQRTPSGWVRKKWKESEVGPRLWRDLYVAPAWYAPPSTPDKDLMRNLWNGRWRLKREVFGPGPRSAYGMVMLIHHERVRIGRDQYRLDDNGVRTHGSSNVSSIARGTSHGCHRLYNHLAVRLGAFLLRHRNHIARGEKREEYTRIVRFRGRYEMQLESRGFLYELDPPVPVEVLRGRIRSVRKRPPR